ncbi:intraflagellar transport protein 43 homolog [Stomoxys calcitrans]|uniref:Intraflagellar transport protein 43 homolog n=1 Tax=Stomoxys calcitrans TaxID=35570 RepID=A0A1I8PFC8_STOCA|nr:intraflagellar transport protein 43 homolog [Stomoxys calcitrans]
MDWAEELKMSIRKTTARKGRRSKSRDVLKDAPPTSSNSTSAQLTSSANAELSLDLNLDIQTSTSNNVSTPFTAGSSAGGAGDISSLMSPSASDTKRPPMLRRISGGWADSSSGGKLKSKKGSFEDERFGLKSPNNNSPIDDIPIIPDLDDIKDDMLMNEIAEPPSIAVNRVVTLKELNSDLLSQNAFSAIDDVDLSILTKCLQPQETLDEADEVWEWQKLFTDVVAEINSDKPLENKMKKLELKPDELPPPMDDD